MIRPFLKLSLRNLFRKNRLFTFINVFGLSVGFACVLLVARFVNDEYAFDRFHKNAERIHRIVTDFAEKGNTVNWARTSAPVGHYLMGNYPEIEQVVRIRKNSGTDLLSNNEVKFYEERLLFADSTLFDVFDFHLINGNPETALRDKNSIVITDALAKKYFIDGAAVGKTLRFNNSIDLKVTGILEPIPANSHITADAFITFSTLDDILGEKRLTHWGWMDHYTYVRLTKAADPAALQSKLPAFIKQNAPAWVPEKETLLLQSLTSIHLHSDRKDELTPNSNEKYSYILGTIAFFVLLMACANFINLSTATLTHRLKEISIQKILGAHRIHLALFFWVEAILCCILALALAFAMMFVVLPYFNLATGKQIPDGGFSWLFAPSLVLAIVVGFLAGFIPAIQAAKIHTLSGIRAHASMFNGKSYLRTALTTVQLSISTLLLIATWIVSSQLDYLQASRFGFSSERTIVIPIKDRSQNEKHLITSRILADIPGVTAVSFSSSMPACNNAYTYTYNFSGSDVGEQVIAAFLVDQDFFKLYDIELAEGRLPDIESKDTLVDVVINEATVKQFGLRDPIGRLVTGQVQGKIVGVVKDFNFETLQSPVKPMVMYYYPGNFRFVSVKFQTDNYPSQLSTLDKRWQETYPGYPLEYFFIDDKIQQLYGAQFQLSSAYNAFSSLAIVIAVTGLIGLTSYLLARRLKEMSVRKIFGSSTLELIGWVYSGYFRIVMVAILVAWCLSYYLMNRWLQGFAFRIELTTTQFLLPALIVIIILVLSTIIQTIRASSANPINSLRNE